MVDLNLMQALGRPPVWTSGGTRHWRPEVMEETQSTGLENLAMEVRSWHRIAGRDKRCANQLTLLH
jgi:hypothetical protein